MDDPEQSDAFNSNRDYDGPAPYHFEPVRQPRENSAAVVHVPRYRQEMEAWAQNNQWRVGQSDWYVTC